MALGILEALKDLVKGEPDWHTKINGNNKKITDWASDINSQMSKKVNIDPVTWYNTGVIDFNMLPDGYVRVNVSAADSRNQPVPGQGFNGIVGTLKLPGLTRQEAYHHTSNHLYYRDWDGVIWRDWVEQAIAKDVSLKASINNPAFTGIVKAPVIYIDNSEENIHSFLRFYKKGALTAELFSSKDASFTIRAHILGTQHEHTFTKSAFYTGISIDLGSSTYKWKDLYAASVINTSDERQKENITVLDKIKDFFMTLKPVKFRYKDGTSGRTHHGLIAQEVETAMVANELTDMDFAGLIKSPVYKKEYRVIGQREVVYPDVWNEDHTEIIEPGHTEMVDETENIPVEEREIIDYVYGLRYTEFIPMLIKVVQDQQTIIEDLTLRVSKLENQA